MHHQIEQRLGTLIGLPLWAIGRAADLAWFQFGRRRDVVDHHGRTRTVGDWALHVECAWRLTRPQGLVVAQADLYEPSDASRIEEKQQASQAWSLEHGGPTRFDERIAELSQVLNANSLIVEQAEANVNGGARIALTGDYVLEILPEATREDECWRLFEPYRGTPHLVVRRSGAELN